MALQLEQLYEFGPFRVDPTECLLTRLGHPVPITPKAFDILLVLIHRSGHLIEKSELFEAVWGDSFVEEGNLTVAISTLRKALGDDDRREHKYIQTVAKRGYRFVGEVRKVPSTGLDYASRGVTQPEPKNPISNPSLIAVASEVDPAPFIAAAPSQTSRASIFRLPVSLKFAVLILAGLGTLVGLWRYKKLKNPPDVEATQQKVGAGRDAAETADLGLAPHLSSRASTRLKLADKNSQVYQLYTTGRYFWNKRTVEGLRRSIECFEQATMQDATFAPAYAGLADAYVLLDSYGVESSRQAYPSAKAAALRSLQLDDFLPEAHASLGMVSFFYEWDWTKAETEFRRAIELDPNYAMARSWYALDLVAMGRPDEALDQVQQAHNLDPLSLIIDTEVGWVYYSSRRFPQAIEAFRNVIDLDQHFARAHTRLGMAYTAQKDFALAVREFKKAQELSGPDAYVDGLLGYALALTGDKNAARKLLTELTERSRHQYVPAFSMALICLGLGERDHALDWLNKAFEERPTYMVYAKTDPLLDSIRPDPRFSALVTRMGLHATSEIKRQ
jgi:DNA-binding winged helix-turn-helix (wHTH) protein/Flp pilus assembly protein TadD